MASEKKITMREYNGTDYDTLYPKTIAEQVEGIYSKEDVLSNDTKALYGLADSAVPDDAFQAIAKMKGKYLYRISVKFSDGDPVVGVVVNGLNPILGETLRTNKDGIAFSASDSASVTVSVSGYIGVKDGSATVTVTSADGINEGVLTLEKDPDYQLITASDTKLVYPGASSVDICTVGGGSKGQAGLSTIRGGYGGGGGYVTNSMNLHLDSEQIKFEIGAQSGTTNVYSINPDTSEETLISSAEGANGQEGNGRGGDSENDVPHAGESSTIYLFNDSALGLAGGGGGGSGGVARGGSPNGGTGGNADGGSPNYGCGHAGKVPGGGGGGGIGGWSNVIYRDGGAGAAGGAYIRVNF